MKCFCVPDERDDIERGWVVCVSEEFHQSMNDACCNFGEFDSSDVNRLDEELTIFRSLNHTKIGLRKKDKAHKIIPFQNQPPESSVVVS